MGIDKKVVNDTPGVLITRPEGQNSEFASACEKLGMQISLLPCLQIIARDFDVAQWQQNLPQHDIALFTSVNAVRFAHRLMPLPWSGIKVHAIGSATARVLQEHGQQIALQPVSPFNSEAYLAQAKNLQPQRLLLIKGVGGRDLIPRSLQALGWLIQSLDVYERTMPEYPAAKIDEIFADKTPDVVSVSSNETLENLWSLCKPHRHTLINSTLLCNSERCAALALKLGFVYPPMIAVPAGDAGQLLCLGQWLETQQPQ